MRSIRPDGRLGWSNAPMLAYRHAFHAGNHADVLKHVVLLAVLDHATAKDAPLTYVDTHAGAGGYALDGKYASKNAEHRLGAQAVWDLAGRLGVEALPQALQRYVLALQEFNPQTVNSTHRLTQYPGSPALAAGALRQAHAMRLYEKHPTEERILAGYLGSRLNTRVHLSDGFEGLERELPSPGRRAVVLMDPSYELKMDYAKVVGALREGLRRMAVGTFIVWYPKVSTVESTQLPRRLLAAAAVAPKGWLHVHTTVGQTNASGHGLTGSGVVVVNPPHTLEAQLRECLPLMMSVMAPAEEPTRPSSSGATSLRASKAPRFSISVGGDAAGGSASGPKPKSNRS
jgi:23S rRNA (adenine2030-N6)-methyltransferase